MPKFITIEQAVDLIPDGAVVMFGGFMGCGNAHSIIDALSKSGKSGFTMIGNDAAMPGGPLNEDYYGVAKLIHNRQVKKLITTHVGLNPEVAQQSMAEGTLEVSLLPQGSLAEMIRAGGAGLGGILTPTGIGTLVEDSEFVHSRVNVDGRDFLLMRPLHADVAILSGHTVDRAGNIIYQGTARNFSPLMATAADLVIVEADEIVDAGKILPEQVMTSGVFVDYVVEGGGVTAWTKSEPVN